MRIRILAGTFVLGAACALIATNAISQQHDHDHDNGHAHDHDGAAGHDQDMPSEEEMMQLWMEVAAPGEQHAKLGYFVGDWDTVTRMWMAPGQPPAEETGTATMEWDFGKRFIHQQYDSTMMGMPYHGGGLTGYDNYKKKWVSVWASNMGTNISYMEGTIDQTGKVWSYFGSMDEWMTGEHDKTVKYVTRITGKDTFLFEIHDLAIVPGETKVIEIQYTRKK